MATCLHVVKIKGLCGVCGAKVDSLPSSTSVSMIHSNPELKLSQEYAEQLGKADQERLIKEQKLVLLVDLDQTILHTTHEEVRDDPTVHSFKLWPGHPTYYTKIRPYLDEFLEAISKTYELHIFTFGCREYANKIASIIDPDGKYFSNRILTRTESSDQHSKLGNLSNLFPCGDAMVCIIDDRADVWRGTGNLIQVKPYVYFKTSISDGAMPRQPTSPSAPSSVKDNVNMNSERDEKSSRETTNKDQNDYSQRQIDDSSDENDDDDATNDEDDEDDEENQRLADILEDLVERPDPVEDTHLKDLPRILNWIHDRWYKEYNERTRHLERDEHYQLPDLKDIIRVYLRKK